MRRLPPLNAMRAFEATARNASFTRAAAELCVTQSSDAARVKLALRAVASNARIAFSGGSLRKVRVE